MLCSICRRIPLGFFFGEGSNYKVDSDGRQYFQFRMSVAALQTSAPLDCELCQLLKYNIRRSKRSMIREDDSWSTCSNAESLPEDEKTIRVRVSETVGNTLTLVGIRKGLAWRGYIRFDMNGAFRPVAKHSGCEGPTSQLKEWLDECIKNHPNCRPLNSSGDNFMPTRLLEIGEDARLVLTETFQDKAAKYLALSHCWGDGVPETATTTIMTLSDRLHSIPVTDLTPNFRDICILAQKLRIRYVWIDSLCIVQDSLEDWTRESGLMGKIFSHSYCTIGAAMFHEDFPQPPSDSEPFGFLGNRKPRYTNAATILENPMEASNKSALQPVSSQETAVNKSNESRSVTFYPAFPTWDEAYNGCPLSQRGWTVQERELSVRGVFYTKRQMIWECQKGHATEQIPAIKEFGRKQRLFFPPTNNKALMLDRWYDEIEGYTERKLTYPMDKLPAISGLAQTLELTGKLKGYLAGLWEEDLLRGLLWSTCGRISLPLRLTGDNSVELEYLGPSWSWASVECDVRWPLRAMGEYAKAKSRAKFKKPTILSAETVPAGSDPRGRLSSSCIRIRGVLERVQVSINVLGSEYKLRDEFGTEVGEPLWDHDRFNEPELGYFVLPVHLIGGNFLEFSLGLILAPTGESADEYRRLGLASKLIPMHFDKARRQIIKLV